MKYKMRMYRVAWIFVWLAALGVLAGQNKEKTLSADELKELLDKKEVYFLDVREPKELEELGTIKGYVNIPLSQIENRLSEIPKHKLMVTA